MAAKNKQARTLVCLAWFTRQDYPNHRALDPESLHDTFEEWLKNAKQAERKLSRYKHLELCRIIVRSDELKAWCDAQDRAIDPAARSEFASMVAAKRNHSAGDA